MRKQQFRNKIFINIWSVQISIRPDGSAAMAGQIYKAPVAKLNIYVQQSQKVMEDDAEFCSSALFGVWKLFP